MPNLNNYDILNGILNMGIDVTQKEIPIENGSITFIDDGTCHVDFEDKRIKITDVIVYETFNEFDNETNLREDAIYVIQDEGSIYIIVNGEKTSIKGGETCVIASGDCGDNGDNATWKLYDSGLLVISGTGAIGNFGNPNNVPWKDYFDIIYKIQINNGITTIGNYSLGGCKNVTDIDIPESVTTILQNAFYNCQSLKTIILPKSVTYLEPLAFDTCSIEWITIPSGIKTLPSWAFQSCTSLKYINISKSVTKITRAFSDCPSLTDVYYYDASSESDINCTITDNDDNRPFINATKHYGVLYTDDVGLLTENHESANNAYQYRGRITEDFGMEIRYYFATRQDQGYWDLINSNLPTTLIDRFPLVPETDERIIIEHLKVKGDTSRYNSELKIHYLKRNITLTSTIYENDNYTEWKVISGINVGDLKNIQYYVPQITKTGEITSSNIWYSTMLGGSFDFGPILSPSGYSSDVSGATYYPVLPINMYSNTSIRLATVLDEFYNTTNTISFYTPYSLKLKERELKICIDEYWSSRGESNNTIIVKMPYNIEHYTFQRSRHYIAIKTAGEQSYETPTYTVFAEDGNVLSDYTIVASGTYNSTIYWSLDYNGVLTLNGSGELPDCTPTTEQSIPWYEYVDGPIHKIKEINIEGTISSIGNYTFYYYPNLKTVRISAGTLTSIGSHVFDNCTKLESINICPGVTTIGSHLFYNCTNLRTVNLPNTITTLGMYAFYKCTSLISIELPNSITTLGVSMFSYCSNLINVKLPDNIDLIPSHMFNDCTSLKTITIPEYVTVIDGYAFYYCTKLSQVNLPKSLISIKNYGFYYTNLDNSRTTLNATNPGVYYYNALSSLDINCSVGSSNSQFNDAIKHYGEIYINDQIISTMPVHEAISSDIIDSGIYNETINWKLFDTGLLEISGSGELPDCTSSTYKNIPWYKYVNEISEIEIRNDVTSIGNYTFYGYSSLKHVKITDNITNIGEHVFALCSSLKSIKLPNSITTIDEYCFYACSSLISITIPNGIKRIEACAFENCTSLSYINLSKCLTGISYRVFDKTNLDNSQSTIDAPKAGIYYYDALDESEIVYFEGSPNNGHNNAFKYYSQIYNEKIDRVIKIYNPIVEVLDIKAEGICGENAKWTIYTNGLLEISGTGDMYDYDSMYDVPWYTNIYSVTKINITKGITRIGKFAFSNFYFLTDIKIPDSVTTIGERAFDSCAYLESITIPNSVTAIENNAFWTCRKLRNVNIPSSIKFLGESIFRECTSLETIEIPFGVTKLSNSMFDQCNSLINISIPHSVTSIGDYAFYQCNSLQNIILPNSITDINNSAFSSCEKLTYITIPNSVIEIGAFAFNNCNKLSYVNLSKNLKIIKQGAFNNTNLNNNYSNVSNSGIYYYDAESDADINCTIEPNYNSIFTNAKKYYGQMYMFDTGLLTNTYKTSGSGGGNISLAINKSTLTTNDPNGSLQIVVKEPLPIQGNIKTIECNNTWVIDLSDNIMTVTLDTAYITLDYQNENITIEGPVDRKPNESEDRYRLLLVWKSKTDIPELMILSPREQIRENLYDYVVISDFTLQDLENYPLTFGTTLWTNPNYR